MIDWECIVKSLSLSLIKVAEHCLAGCQGNSRDRACFKLDKQTLAAKKQWYTDENFSKSNC